MKAEADRCSMKRIEQEKKVVGLMIAMYCRRHHGTCGGALCDDCRSLLDYACRRLDYCRHGNHKPSCRKCPTHCYSPSNREKIREVMRYAGPRMILTHPWAALRHLLSELR